MEDAITAESRNPTRCSADHRERRRRFRLVESSSNHQKNTKRLDVLVGQERDRCRRATSKTEVRNRPSRSASLMAVSGPEA